MVERARAERPLALASALLFDIGDVVMKSNWEMLDDLEACTGRTIEGRGPLDPAGDPDWQRYLGGTIDATEYWERKARRGGFDDRWALWREMCFGLGARQFDADALALIDEARRAGVPVGVLSNDLVAIGGRPWVDTRPELAGFDAFVDATELGERKPAPAPYLASIAQFGVPAHEIVFLDDTPVCVEGARAVGMIGVHVDPTNRARALERARQLVGLAPEREPLRVLAALVDAYRRDDGQRARGLFHPEVLVSCNGVVSGSGVTVALDAHRRHRLHGRADVAAVPMVVDDDAIALEWLTRPPLVETWTIRYGRIIELRSSGPVP